MFPRIFLPLALASLLGACGDESVRGVGDAEIIVGTHMDQSGALRAASAAALNGLGMALDEANTNGGVHGRAIRLLVRDNAGDPNQAETAVHALVVEEQAFAILAPFGTKAVTAAIAGTVDSGALHLFPLTVAREAFDPVHPLKFAFLAPYAEIVREAVRYLVHERHLGRIAVLYRADAFGEDVRRGAESELRAQGLFPAGVVSFPPGAENLSAEIESLKMKDVDGIVFAGLADESVAAMRAVRALGWDVAVIGSPASYVREVAESPEAETMLAVAQIPIPYPDDANPDLRAWIKRYEDRYGAQATAEALAAYAAGRMFVAALEAAGRELTAESFAAALEGMGEWSPDNLGIAPLDYTAADHLGARAAFIIEASHGRWVRIK